jgi:hypothetical protein
MSQNTWLADHGCTNRAYIGDHRWVHVGLTVLTLIDIILVLEFNSYLGIPNKAFVLGLSALGDAVSQFKYVPSPFPSSGI